MNPLHRTPEIARFSIEQIHSCRTRTAQSDIYEPGLLIQSTRALRNAAYLPVLNMVLLISSISALHPRFLGIQLIQATDYQDPGYTASVLIMSANQASATIPQRVAITLNGPNNWD
jgi:hypothetical protein